MAEALLRFEFLQHAVLAVLLGSVACGLIGSLLFVNRLSSLSGGISHAVFGGLGASLLAGIPPLAGASVASIIAALLLGFISARARSRLATLAQVTRSTATAAPIRIHRASLYRPRSVERPRSALTTRPAFLSRVLPTM